jgi:hypothetical protein
MVITAQILGGDIHPSKLFLVFSLPIKGSYPPLQISSTLKINLFISFFIYFSYHFTPYNILHQLYLLWFYHLVPYS